MQILNINQIVFFFTFFLHSECFNCWYSCPEQLTLMDFFKHVKYPLSEQISPFFFVQIILTKLGQSGRFLPQWLPTILLKNLPSVSLWLPQKTSPLHKIDTPTFAILLTMLQVFSFLFLFVFLTFLVFKQSPYQQEVGERFC